MKVGAGAEEAFTITRDTTEGRGCACAARDAGDPRNHDTRGCPVGCNCGGRKKPSPAAAATADPAGDPRPHRWVVDFPNGTSQPFQHEWQANAARAVGGGYPPRKEYLTNG